MRKQDLRDYFESKFTDLRLKNKQEIEDYIKDQVKTLYHNKVTLNYTHLMDGLQVLSKQIYKLYEDFGLLNDWNHSRFLSELKGEKGLKFHEKQIDSITSSIIWHINNPEKVAFNHMFDWVKVFYDTIRKTEKVKNYYKRRKDISKLSSEISLVITTAQNGKKAYEQLKKLGVNMDGLVKEQLALPVPVKLSVDPCLINGDCQ